MNFNLYGNYIFQIKKKGKKKRRHKGANQNCMYSFMETNQLGKIKTFNISMNFPFIVEIFYCMQQITQYASYRHFIQWWTCLNLQKNVTLLILRIIIKGKIIIVPIEIKKEAHYSFYYIKFNINSSWELL